MVPGQVQNLKSALDTNTPSLTLHWDKPSNVKTAEDVTAYDIRFRPAGSSRSKDYHKMTVDSQATSVLLTRENGLNPLTAYDFEVRARNAEHHEGQWSKVSKYIGMHMFIAYVVSNCELNNLDVPVRQLTTSWYYYTQSKLVLKLRVPAYTLK